MLLLEHISKAKLFVGGLRGYKTVSPGEMKELTFWIACILAEIGLRLKVLLSFTDDITLFNYTLYQLPSNVISYCRIVQMAMYYYEMQKLLEEIEKEMGRILDISEFGRSVHNQEIFRIEFVAETIESLRHTYFHIWMANKAINAIFGHGLLMNILRIFVEAICNCFWVYSSIYNNNFEQVDGNDSQNKIYIQIIK